MSSVADDPTLEQSPVAEQLGPYRLVRKLGQGGMGVVHLATGADGEQVAVKVLRPHVAHDPTARARLEREVSTLQRVDHPGVAGVLDHDLHCERPYLVTRYVPGPQLDQLVEERGPLTPRRLLMTAGCLAESLQAIHAVGVIHRDLKPGNVLVHEGRPVIIDFGIAQAADDLRLTATGLVIGTPGYVSPELIEGAAVTESADWWGWAATVVFAATGRRPFGRGPFEAVLHRVQAGKADLEGIDPRLAPLLAAALSPDQADRPTAEQILTGLRRYGEGRDAFVRSDSSAATTLQPVGSADDGAVVPGIVVPGNAAPGSATPGSDVPEDGGDDGTRVMPAVDGTAVLPAAAVAPAPATADVTPEQMAALIPPLIPSLNLKRTPQQPPYAVNPYAGALPVPYQPDVQELARFQQVAPNQPGQFQPAPVPPGQVQPGHIQPGHGQSGHGPVQPGPFGPPAQQRPRSVAGSGTITALFVLTVAAAALYPLLTAIAVICGIVIARVVDRTGTAMMRRRQVRGGRGRSDGLVATLLSPVQLAVAALITLPCLILPFLMATISGAIVAVGLASVKGLHWPLLTVGAVASGACMGLLAAWWGPGGTSLRRGAHVAARATLRPTWFRALVVTGMLVIALFCGLAALSGRDTSWAPAGDPLDRSNLPQAPQFPSIDLPGIDIPFIGSS
jgi:serine/threonine protein kinase